MRAHGQTCLAVSELGNSVQLSSRSLSRLLQWFDRGHPIWSEADFDAGGPGIVGKLFWQPLLRSRQLVKDLHDWGNSFPGRSSPIQLPRRESSPNLGTLGHQFRGIAQNKIFAATGDEVSTTWVQKWRLSANRGSLFEFACLLAPQKMKRSGFLWQN